MIKFKCKLYSCRNADLILILVVAMTNGFIFKTIFIIAILEVGVGGGGGMLDQASSLTWNSQLFIHSIKLVKKLLNVGSTCNQSVSQSKLQRVNPTVIQSVSQSFNQSFIQLKEGSQLPTSCLSEDARMSRQQQNRAAQDNNVEIM